MPEFDWANAINIVLTGILAMVSSVVAGTVAAVVTHRLTKNRDEEEWARELVLVEERWKTEMQLLQAQWEHQQEEKEADRLRQALLQGVDAPMEAIKRASWLHFSEGADTDQSRDSAREFELTRQDFLVIMLIELLRTRHTEPLPMDKRDVISQGLELLCGVRLSEDRHAASVEHPESVTIAAYLAARGKLELLEVGCEVLEMLQAEDGGALPSQQRVEIALDLLREVHKGILDELESVLAQ